MFVTIDNIDYTSALDAAHPLTIQRTLNAPSVCELSLLLPPDNSLAVPARFQSITVAGDDGTLYFTGYIASTPLPQYAGLALDGPQYRLAIRAISEEMLFDLALASPAKGISGLNAGAALSTLAAHTGSPFNAKDLTLEAPIGRFTPDPGAPFSKSAGQLAAQARAAYRAHGGTFALNSIPVAVHALDETAGTLTLASLTLTRTRSRDLANDMTVCGAREPAAYVTEIFQGDGVTSSFNLSAAPWFPPAGKTTLISELFDKPFIDTTLWSNPSGSVYFSPGTGGLVMNGGSGVDSQTMLSWLDPVEMGGTLVLEAEGLTLANASTGLLAAFLPIGPSPQQCVAGFEATAQQGSGAVSLQPIVYGAACGAAFVINPTNQYTLRIRVHCPEPNRTLAAYRSCGDDGAITAGGQLVISPACLLFEIQEFVDGVAAMPVTLYDGSVEDLPAACIVAAADSLNLHGSLRAVQLECHGSAWVITAAPGCNSRTRRVGSAAQAAECQVERTGRLVFYIGRVPAAGERITVTYRSSARAVGRTANTASQQALAAQGLPSTASWIGSVTSPPARSSADCRNAAAALAASAASSAALWSGSYRCTNFDLDSDVWPGEALALSAPSCNLNAQLIVRTVKLSYRASIPDVFTYDIAFANDWAEDLAIHTSDHVPADAWLPAPASPVFAANLSALTVTALSGDTVTINTGATAPTGGGFEIRSRDYAFMPGEDPSLVMRGSQPHLTFTRLTAADRFYVRMFDAADPPNYSEFSAAVILNVPIGS